MKSNVRIWKRIMVAYVSTGILLASTALGATGAKARQLSPGEKAKVSGAILSRDGDLVRVRDKKSHTVITVSIGDATQIERKEHKFEFYRHTDMDVTALLPGLTIEAEGVGIQQCILDICASVPIHFVIADGIMAMEGNGPLNGTPRPLGTVVLSDDPVAGDATCARLMGLAAHRVAHVREAAKFLGNSSPDLIDQVAEHLRFPTVPFKVVPEFEFPRQQSRSGSS